MIRKVIVPHPINAKIGGFHLSRPMYVMLLTRIHNDIAEDYEKRRNIRSPQDDRLYMHKVILDANPEKHLFRFAIDDSTAPDHLIIVDVQHIVDQ